MTKERSDVFRVSVVIPAYNAEAYIGRALRSVLGQRRGADEVIVVDDGSTDGTAAAVGAFGESVRYIRQEKSGASAARNAGIAAASGEWIAFLDADDEWLPGRLERQLALLARNRELVWVSGNYERCLCWENRRAAHHGPGVAEGLLAGREYYEDFWQAYRRGWYGCTDTMLVSREVLVEAGLFEVGLPRDNDLDLWWRIAYRYPRLGYVVEPLAVYHLDVPASISRAVRPGGTYGAFIGRHLGLAAAAGQLDRFGPVAAFRARRWIRGMLFEGDKKQIRDILGTCRGLLPWGYRAFIWVLTVFPQVTARGCHAISWMVRRLRARRHLVRAPRRDGIGGGAGCGQGPACLKGSRNRTEADGQD